MGGQILFSQKGASSTLSQPSETGINSLYLCFNTSSLGTDERFRTELEPIFSAGFYSRIPRTPEPVYLVENTRNGGSREV